LLSRIAVVILAAIATWLVARGGTHDFHVAMLLDNAYGLRTGSPVKVGGVEVGSVDRVGVKSGRVFVRLAVDPKQVKVHPDAQASITAANLLGEKYVELVPGNSGAPSPDGVLISSSRVRSTVDLDQVLDTLDLPTRTRLAILIKEASIALGGRRRDVAATLDELPHAFGDAERLLGEVVADNHTLADTIARSDQFISDLTPQRRELSHVIQLAGESMQATTDRQAELRQSIEKVPGTLAALHAFLDELDRTTQPLGSAARALSTTARPLSETLVDVVPFTNAARPALAKAVTVSPLLTQLADVGTRTLGTARPTIAALRDLAGAAPRFTTALGSSVDDLLNTIEGWDRAIQTRDGLSHVFRGKATISTDTLRTLVTRLQPQPQPAAQRRAAAPTRLPRNSRLPNLTAATVPTDRPAPLAGLAKTLPLPPDIQRALATVQQLLSPGATPAGKRPAVVNSLLNFLIGR
jgi:phospholipid/cholesterol/gamma-HCH transport system substrate-binding protein